MSEQLQEKKYPMKQSAALATGTFATVGIFDLLAHLGPTGLVVGSIASYVAWKHGPEIVDYVKEQVRENFPSSTPDELPEQQEGEKLHNQGRGFWEWALGIPAGELEVAGQAQSKGSEREVSGLVDLAKDVQLPVDEIAGKAICVVGMRRSGKTTLGARIAEELGKHYIPLLIPDMEGDYLSLADVLPRAIIVGHPDVQGQYRRYQFEAVVPVQDGERESYFHLNDAVNFGYSLMEYGYQAILDLASYPSLDEAIMVQVGVIRGMFLWADSHPDSRVPAHIYLDEAQRYLPESLKDSVIENREILSELLRAYSDTIAIGGKRGLSPVILSQRFAQTSKKIMAQSEVYFILRQTFDNDLQRCMEFVKKTTATIEQIPEFAKGQGVYIAADGSQRLTRFHQRQSSGERSHTPKAEAAQRYANMPMKRPVQPATDEPRTDRLPTTNPPMPSKRQKTDLERVVELFTEQPMIGYRDAGALLGFGKDKVGELVKEAKERELL